VPPRDRYRTVQGERAQLGRSRPGHECGLDPVFDNRADGLLNRRIVLRAAMGPAAVDPCLSVDAPVAEEGGLCAVKERRGRGRDAGSGGPDEFGAQDFAGW
jgi:hypothetical protein